MEFIHGNHICIFILVMIELNLIKRLFNILAMIFELWVVRNEHI